MYRYLLVIAIFSLLGVGCQKKDQPTTSLTQQQWAEVKKHILDDTPEPGYPINANFEDKVELIGLDIDGDLEPGEQVTFKWYWKALTDLEKNWEIFVHFDHTSEPYRQHLDHQPLKGLYQTGRWSKGQIIEDIQEVTINSDYPPGEAIPYVGLYRGSGVAGRLKLMNDVETDGKRRLMGPRLEISGEFDTPQFRLSVTKAADIEFDGRLNESIWSKKEGIELRPLGGSKKLKSSITPIATSKGLLVGAKLEDDHIWGELKNRDSETWNEEVFELFIDPNRDEKNYMEFQITPKGTIFDARFERRLSSKPVDRASQIDNAKKWDLELESGVHIEGTLNNKDSEDQYWSLELLIPYTQIPGVEGTPDKDDKWAVNFYRYDRPDSKTTYTYAWSDAVSGDFHQIKRFGTLEFPQIKSKSVSEKNSKPTTDKESSETPPHLKVDNPKLQLKEPKLKKLNVKKLENESTSHKSK